MATVFVVDEAMRGGALDFIEKPFHDEELLGSIARTKPEKQNRGQTTVFTRTKSMA